LREPLAQRGHRLDVFARLNLNFDALVAGAQFLFHLGDKLFDRGLNPDRNAARNLDARPADQLPERHILLFRFRVPDGRFHSGPGHFVAANPRQQIEHLRRRPEFRVAQNRPDVVRNDVPAPSHGLVGIERVLSPAVTSPQPLVPSTSTSTSRIRRSEVLPKLVSNGASSGK
jgi:hypothetical protein